MKAKLDKDMRYRGEKNTLVYLEKLEANEAY
jgi:hypothetical protein